LNESVEIDKSKKVILDFLGEQLFDKSRQAAIPYLKVLLQKPGCIFPKEIFDNFFRRDVFVFR